MLHWIKAPLTFGHWKIRYQRSFNPVHVSDISVITSLKDHKSEHTISICYTFCCILVYSTTNGKVFEKPLTFDHHFRSLEGEVTRIQKIIKPSLPLPIVKLSSKFHENLLCFHGMLLTDRKYHQIQLETIPTSASLPLDISSFCKTAHKHILF